MITKASNGFLSVLGSQPVTFALFLTMVATLKIPRDEDENWEPAALRIYIWVLLMHLVTFVTIVLNN